MKIFKVSLAAAMLCAWASFTAMAAEGTISFSDPQVNAGDEVNVTMKVTADEGTALDSANIVLTYPSGLEFVSGTDADGGAGAVRVHGTTNGAGTAQLEYNLKFKTSQAGSFGIGIDSYEVYDSDDQPIEFTHLGSSTVTVDAGSGSSQDTSLSSLEVYPGTLDPAFSADVAEYNLTVGLGVSDITVNAIGAEGSANVSIQKSYDGELPEGASDVVVTISSADGSSSTSYTIHVNKVEGGPETADSSAVNVEGIKLSSKGKTIIVMNPPEDVTVPDGLKEGTITIDGQKVQGWVWGASEEPEYCVVYGMTADSSKTGDSQDSYGNIGFYRYDMNEKTIQRYFVDPLAAGSVSSAEYTELQDQLSSAKRSAETRLIIMVALAVIAFAAVMMSVYMSIRYKTNEKVQRAYRRRSLDRIKGDGAEADVRTDAESGLDASSRGTGAGEADNADAAEGAASDGINRAAFSSGAYQSSAAAADSDEAKDLLRHDFSAGSVEAAEQNAADETQVIKRPERKRKPRRVIKAVRIEDEEIADIDTPDAVSSKADAVSYSADAQFNADVQNNADTDMQYGADVQSEADTYIHGGADMQSGAGRFASDAAQAEASFTEATDASDRN